MSVAGPHPLRSLTGIAGQGCGLFVLPFLVGAAAGSFLEVTEVADTGRALSWLSILFIAPPLVLQLLGIVLKVQRERAFLHARGERSSRALLASVHRHISIVTPRGWAVLLTGLWFVFLALAFKWASLGLLAVLSLLLFYVVLGGTSFVSTFLVQTFAAGLGRGASGIRRELSPAVVTAGEPAEERFTLSQVPVPAGFLLLIEDGNPPPLGTESRYAVGAGARRKTVTLSGRFRRTPRGLHRLGPAHIWYQDALGFTRVSVASLATAELKVLPRFYPLEIIAPPRSRLEAPDILTRPHRFATEDHFRFKEYHTGDDTRRIQWRLSVRTGRLQVRQPENREISSRKVLLLLDTYMPKGRVLDDAVGLHFVLDRLVETWISLAAELVERGEQVAVAAAVDDGKGNIHVEIQPGDRNARRRWQDIGARARWQGDLDIVEVLSKVGPAQHGVAVSSRFDPPPSVNLAGQDFTWIYLSPEDALGPSDPPLWEAMVGPGPGAGRRLVARMFRLPGPAGSDETAFLREIKDILRLRGELAARARLRAFARLRGKRTLEALVARGDGVYRLEPGPVGHRLVGLASAKAASGAR